MSKHALSKLSFENHSINKRDELFDERSDESTQECTSEKREGNLSEGTDALLNAEAISLSLQRAKTKKKSMLRFTPFKKSLEDGHFDITEPLMCSHPEENRIQPNSWESGVEKLTE